MLVCFGMVSSVETPLTIGSVALCASLFRRPSNLFQALKPAYFILHRKYDPGSKGMNFDKAIAFFERMDERAEKRRMRSILKKLRRKGELEPFLDESRFVLLKRDDGYHTVSHKDASRNNTRILIAAPSKDEAIWWIIKNAAYMETSLKRTFKSVPRDSIVLPSIFDKLADFLKWRQMCAGLKKLRVENKLDQILEEARYEVVRPDFGEDYFGVYPKGHTSRAQEVFSALSRDEAIWWIVRKHQAEQETGK